MLRMFWLLSVAWALPLASSASADPSSLAASGKGLENSDNGRALEACDSLAQITPVALSGSPLFKSGYEPTNSIDGDFRTCWMYEHADDDYTTYAEYDLGEPQYLWGVAVDMFKNTAYRSSSLEIKYKSASGVWVSMGAGTITWDYKTSDCWPRDYCIGNAQQDIEEHVMLTAGVWAQYLRVGVVRGTSGHGGALCAMRALQGCAPPGGYSTSAPSTAAPTPIACDDCAASQALMREAFLESSKGRL